MIQDGRILVDLAGQQPQVEAERLRALEEADIGAENAAIGVVEVEGVPSGPRAEYGRFEDGNAGTSDRARRGD